MLKIKNLTVAFGNQEVLKNISLNIKNGEIVGVVGESGSGKSMTALAVMGLLSETASVKGHISVGEHVVLNNEEQLKLSSSCYDDALMRKMRGSSMSMVFQDPMTSLNPTLTIGKQVGEVLKLHTNMEKQQIKEEVIKIFYEVGLNNPELIYDSYPHMLSGGMRQRVMIAMAIILQPNILIADEPTTALDVTIQRQIIELIKEINKKKNTSVFFVTHDLTLAKGFCDRVIVMENGNIVENGTVEQIFNNPKQEYTKKLIGAIPTRTKRRRVVYLNASEV